MEETVEFFEKLLSTPQELDDELSMYLERLPSGFLVLRHPLVFSVPHSPAKNALLNYELKTKKKRLSHALKEKDYETFLWTHERPYRCRAFDKIKSKFSDADYWKTLGEIWVDSENIWQDVDLWKKFLSSKRPDRNKIMSEEDLAVFDKLPSNITIYRGQLSGRTPTFSWTLNEEKAEWFANRYFTKKRSDVNAEVLTKVINKVDVLAYFGGRGEQEIVILK